MESSGWIGRNGDEFSAEAEGNYSGCCIPLEARGSIQVNGAKVRRALEPGIQKSPWEVVAVCWAEIEASGAAKMDAISARAVRNMPKWIVYCTGC